VHNVVVVGAGLAGLTVARALRARGFDVTILDSAERAGGKAGSDQVDGIWREHGYHVFPAWYVNTRKLLGELGVPPLVDFDCWHTILPDPRHRIVTHRVPRTFTGFLDVLRGALVPWQHAALYYYFVLDMLAEPLDHAARLDQVSRVGLMRSRWYRTDRLAELEEENVLKASAIPVYDMSAMTAKIISAYWVRHRLPFLSILPGDLQATFIAPFVRDVVDAGVRIELGHKVTAIEADGPRVGRVTAVDRGGAARAFTADDVVITTPLEVTRRLIGADLQRLDPDLGNFEHLPAAPMAALHLTLKSVRPFPREHVFLHGGRYGLSFIDQTSHWSGLATTTLSFISSNFAPLRDLPPRDQYEMLLEEITQYLGITAADVDSHALRPNVETPLFINTIGAWHNRPQVASKRIENLFFAGDWVRNPVDLACMEGAISSALEAARAVGQRHGVALPGPAVATTYNPTHMRILRRLLAPLMFPIWLYARYGRD